MGDRGAGRGRSCGRRGLGPRQPSRAVCLHRILVPTGAGSPLGTSVLKLRVIPQGDLAVAVIRPKVKADWAKAESLLCPVRPADAPSLPPFLLPPCQIARPRGFSEPLSEGALSRGPAGRQASVLGRSASAAHEGAQSTGRSTTATRKLRARWRHRNESPGHVRRQTARAAAAAGHRAAGRWTGAGACRPEERPGRPGGEAGSGAGRAAPQTCGSGPSGPEPDPDPRVRVRKPSGVGRSAGECAGTVPAVPAGWAGSARLRSAPTRAEKPVTGGARRPQLGGRFTS